MLHGRWVGATVTGLLLLSPAAARAVDDEAIKHAVERGVQHLRMVGGAELHGAYGYPTGATALVGLALVEGGLAQTDPAVQRHAAIVREAAPSTYHTYSLSLSVLFLSRLHDPDDVPLIQVMGVRLLMGQRETGGWGYNCPMLGGPDEIRKLRGSIKAAPGAKPPEKGENEKPGAPPAAEPKPSRWELPRELLQQLLATVRPVPEGQFLGMQEDNSNTQFAILGLWTARRYGVPADDALAAVARRFRVTQNHDGGWGYSSGARGEGSSPAMTCAGLLGLAAAYGAANEMRAQDRPKDTPSKKNATPKKKDADKAKEDAPADKEKKKPLDPGKDLAVRGGMLYLGNVIGKPHGREVLARGEAFSLMREFYFLWSLERVAVAYGLATIGKKDWYAWGAEILLETQNRNGSWMGQYGQGGIDTCFAILFLRKANLAEDLTTSLRGMSDIGEVELRGGGIGGADLKTRGYVPAIQLRERSGKAAKSAPLTEAGKHLARLSQAEAGERQAILIKLRDGKGADFTQALADAITQLPPGERVTARDALAVRLSRMSAATLRDKLKDAGVEVRRAAALACAMREDRAHVPDLIPLLKDADTHVARAAHVALKELAGRDFGPAADASRSQVEEAIANWKAWWEKEADKGDE
jgi:hypothetical protein